MVLYAPPQSKMHVRAKPGYPAVMVNNHIAGQSRPSLSGDTLVLHDPATGVPRGTVAASGPADIDLAVQAARSAFPAWSAMSITARGERMLALANLVDRDAEQLAHAECVDTGKPISTCRQVDIPRAAANLRYFAHAAAHVSGQWHQYDGAGVQGARPAINLTLRRARGVAGLISPWNLPLYLLTWKIAPALITGNTAVCKPSEVTPTTASMLAALAIEAGLPAGVLNVVHGAGAAAGGALVEHAQVPAISFTGSTAVGRWIGARGGAMLKRISLELGGKNPLIVFEDADVDAAAEIACRASFSNQGQICLCASRIIVHESVREKFLARLVELAGALRPGDPLDGATRYGAVSSAAHLAKIEAAVGKARELGGRVLVGGRRPSASELPARCASGWFYMPTIVDGLNASCEVEQQEIFGPVVSVQSFTDEARAIELANGTSYGLAAVVLTQNLARAHRAAAQLDAGIVWVNCWMVRDLRTPFGGAKESGVGREGGIDALNFFTEPTNVCISM